ncbi:MAG: choice-of-anchor J domain-containing protein, partial [Acidobacteriota bacterium]
MKNTLSAFLMLLLLFSLNAGANTADRGIVLNESFEGGLPPTWSFYQLGNPPTDDWEINGYSHGGSKCVFHAATPPLSPDSWMVTPQISVSSAFFYLSFWESTHAFDNFNLHEVLISDGSGNPVDGDFTDIVHSVPGGNPEIYSEILIPLSAYEGQDIFIAFRYQNNSGQWGDQWHIDDVMVVETDLAHDLGSVGLSPAYHASLSAPSYPEVTIRNFGSSTESGYSVNLTIAGTAYDETVQVPESLGVMELTSIAFPDWRAGHSGVYTLNVTVILANDENPGNDSFSMECEVFSPNEYSAETVYSIEYEPVKRSLNKTIKLDKKTGEKVYLQDHSFGYPYELAAMTWMNGKIIAVQRDVCDVFVVTPTGNFIRIGNIPNLFYINGLAYDEVNQTLYGVGLADDAIDDILYTIDENWHASQVMAIWQKIFIYGLAASSLGDLYGISIQDGSLFTIDPDLQQIQDVGIIDGLSMGMQIQDIGFDRETDTLYGT